MITHQLIIISTSTDRSNIIKAFQSILQSFSIPFPVGDFPDEESEFSAYTSLMSALAAPGLEFSTREVDGRIVYGYFKGAKTNGKD
jgi:hypothetical protein